MSLLLTIPDQILFVPCGVWKLIQVSSTISVDGKAMMTKEMEHEVVDTTIRQSVTGDEVVTEIGESAACKEMTSASSRGKKEYSSRMNLRSRNPRGTAEAVVDHEPTHSQGECGGHGRGFRRGGNYRHGGQNSFSNPRTQLRGGAHERGLHYHAIRCHHDQDSLNYEQTQLPGGEHGRSDRGFHHHKTHCHRDQDSCWYVNDDIGWKSSSYHHTSHVAENPAAHGHCRAQHYQRPRFCGDAYKTKNAGHTTREESFVERRGRKQQPSSRSVAKPSRGCSEEHAEQLQKQPRDGQSQKDNPVARVSELPSDNKDKLAASEKLKEITDRPQPQHRDKRNSDHHQPRRKDREDPGKLTIQIIK